jgi:dCMP deaminase
MRPSIDDYFIAMVQLIATRSTCRRREVGCILVNKRNHVLATGYNGVAAGLPHCSESTGFDFVYDNGVDLTKPLTGQATSQKLIYANACPAANAAPGTQLDGCEAIHAEQNALLQCRDVYEITTCYVTASPCTTCTKLLLNTSCQRIVFIEEYPHALAAELWVRNNRMWQRLNNPPTVKLSIERIGQGLAALQG